MFQRTILPAVLATLALIPLRAELPPLLDRDLFFGEVEISGAQISPDGQYVSFLKPFQGARNIWVKKAGEPFSAARPVTAETRRPIPGYFWSRDSKYILYVKDQDGDENFNVYAVSPSDPAPAGAAVPPSRNLSNAKGARTIIYEVPRSDPAHIYIGLNDRDPAWHDLYRLNLATGEKSLLRRNTDRITGWVFDHKAQPRIATRSAENGDTEFLRVDEKGFTKIYSCSVLETCQPVRFDETNAKVYFLTNAGELDLVQLMLMDPATGAATLVEKDPLGRVDLAGTLFSEVSNRLIATIYEDDRERLYWKDKAFEADYQWLQKQLPGFRISFGSRTADESRWILTAARDTEPGETYVFDRKTRRIALQYRIREKLPREALAPMKVIRYRSSDGLEIPAFLTLPKGVEPKGLPLVVFPHGGPWARDIWGYNTFHQFLANRGYAVLSPNFRGSTGYGKRFLNAGNRQWGDRMQDDITWGVRHLAGQGIVDPKRVGIMGASYGGYATLAGVAFTPDLYAAAVAIVAPSNLITLLDSIPPYWEPIRKMFYERMGDPNTPEGRQQLVRQSPLFSAGRIRTPLMVVQGANDPRVKKRESDQIVIALRDRKFPVEYLVADDEGHGFARPVNNLAMIAAVEKFLAKYLGGRYQESMPPEVEKRLKELTVDPATVKLPDMPAPTASLPSPAAPPSARPHVFQAKIEAGGQSFAVEMRSVIEETPEGWRATDTMKTPMGEATDTALLERGSYTLKKRSVRQGPVEIEFMVDNGRARGSMKMGGQERPIDAALDGPLFADGAGSLILLASLPLAEGYSAAYRTLDLQTQKTKLFTLKVAGSETVAVPAGTFDCWRVELEPADGSPGRQTLYVAKKERRPVKLEASLPQMGGAKMTAELAQ
ncbi:MAG: prolyl oligopeptidase family serine peptidase [Bryobacteraceae bacterium]|nr:prolyl oligopeptidase family serine peptidase [Bryobacteraceae bacterium]